MPLFAWLVICQHSTLLFKSLLKYKITLIAINNILRAITSVKCTYWGCSRACTLNTPDPGVEGCTCTVRTVGATLKNMEQRQHFLNGWWGKTYYRIITNDIHNLLAYLWNGLSEIWMSKLWRTHICIIIANYYYNII